MSGESLPRFDARTEANVATLLPPLQRLARLFLVAARPHLAPEGVSVKVISGLRTYEEQAALYAQGRTAPGRVVTNARPGYSMHNFSLAFDIGLFRGADYLPDSPLYAALGPVGEGVGLAWGGRWKSFPDRPHYELRHGLTLAQLRQRKAAGVALLKGTAYEQPATERETPPGQWVVRVGERWRAVDANATDEIRFVAEALGASLSVAGKTITVTPKDGEVRS